MSITSKELRGTTILYSQEHYGDDGLDLERGIKLGENLKRKALEECV